MTEFNNLPPLPPQEPQKVSPNTEDRQEIKELDLSNLELPALQEELTNQIGQGNVLHGSQRNLSIVNPSDSLLYLDPNSNNATDIKAVFATDNPIIALARATAGNQLEEWRNYILFKVNAVENLPEKAYVYVLPENKFDQNPNDASEYTCEKPIIPTTRIVFDTRTIISMFRTSSEYIHATALSAYQINPEAVRDSDITAALLSIRNMIVLAGYIDYTTQPNSKEEDRFIRLSKMTEVLQPVLERFPELATPEQKKLGKKIRRLYEENTGEVDLASSLLFHADKFIMSDTKFLNY